MGLMPSFLIEANNNDISQVIMQLYEYITITDKTGYESDICEIGLVDDPRNPIAIPEKGAELKISIGYDGDLVPMGLFVVDEVDLEGPPERMVIRARASIQIDSKNGMVSITSQKTRSWIKDTTIEVLVSRIAKDHGLDAIISDTLRTIRLPHFDQSDESDLSFLMRIAKRYDAVCKPAGGKLLFIKKGESNLPALELNRYQLSSWRMVSSAKNSIGTIIAYWHEKKQAKKQEIKIGEGEPVRRLRHLYSDESSANMAAKAAMDQAKRSEETLTLTLPGNPLISAEMPLFINDVREGINGEWVVDEVTHSIDKSIGYSCDINAVKSLVEDT